MRIKSRFVFRSNEEQSRTLYALAEVKRKPSIKSSDLDVIEIFQDSENYPLFLDELKNVYPDYLVSYDETFTKQELLDAPVLRIVPNTHRGGYPQPESTHLDYTHDSSTGCPHCSKGRVQNRSLRLKSSTKIGSSDISGIWWLRDLIVNARLKELIEDAGLTGCEFWPVIKHGKDEPFEEFFQLKITGEMPPMAVETNIVHNSLENYKYACPYGCGSLSVEGAVCYNSKDLKQVSDFALTKEWFGSGHEFWRWPFMSHNAYKLFVENKIKGVRFYPPTIIE